VGFERKLFIRLIVIIGAFLPLVGISIFTIQKLINDESTVIEANARQSLLVERLQFFNASKNQHMPAFILSGDKRHLESFYEYHALFNITLDEILKLEHDPEDLALLQKLKADSDEAFIKVAPGIKMIESRKPLKEIDAYFRTSAAPIVQEVSEMARQLAISSAKHGLEARDHMKGTIRHLESAIVILAILAVFLSAWATNLIVKLARQKRISDEQAERISLARKEIVEVVAHDVKSPVATIQMAVDLLKTDADVAQLSAPSKRAIAMIERSARSVNNLINDLLDHAKIESGNLVVELVPSDLGIIVEDVVARFQMLAQAKRITLKLELPENPLILQVDSARMDQAVSNLLSNAIKFTPEGGCVRVSCNRTASGAEIFVEDSGPGLKEEQVTHIFDRYFQVKKGGRQGTGLGLSIVKSIVEAHRGSIGVESPRGQGAKFRLSLPV
jgi:signal transduction histidine kinase